MHKSLDGARLDETTRALPALGKNLSMKVKVRVLRREGRNLPRQEYLQPPLIEGELGVAPERGHELGRSVLRAHLRDASHGGNADLLPELTDVSLLFVGEGQMRLSGFEQIDRHAYAQTWEVQVQ